MVEFLLAKLFLKYEFDSLIINHRAISNFHVTEKQQPYKSIHLSINLHAAYSFCLLFYSFATNLGWERELSGCIFKKVERVTPGTLILNIYMNF